MGPWRSVFGLGIRPRSELQRGGGLRRLSPQEAPTRRRGDRPRRRVSVPRLTSASGSLPRSRDPTLGDRRDLVGCLPSRSAAPCVYGRKGVVLAETARDPRGDWLLSRPSRAGAASPRPLAGKPAESNQLTDLAGSGWSTGRRLDRGRSASGERVIERAGPRRVGPFAFDDAVAQATRIVRSSSGGWPGWPRTAPGSRSWSCIGPRLPVVLGHSIDGDDPGRCDEPPRRRTMTEGVQSRCCRTPRTSGAAS
jgi:hypothetical protein